MWAGGGGGESMLHGARVSVWEHEKVLETDGGGGGVASQCEGTTELTVHLKTVTMAHFRLSIFYHNLKKLEKNLGMKSS